MLPYLGVRFQIRYHHCNLKCPYCIASWSKQGNLFDEVTFGSIVDRVGQWPYRISLRIGVGGEIFTSPQLMKGVQKICNSDSHIFNVSFSTNLAADWQRVIRPFIDSTDTGKLGMGCTLHDTVIDDVDDFFRKAENLKKAGVEVYVGYVAIPGRINDIAKYKRRCDELDIPLIMNGLIGRLLGEPNADPSLVFPKDYTRSELEALKSLWDTPHSYQLLLEACQTRGMTCSAGRNYVYIDHKGNVFPCKKSKNSMGNILGGTIGFQEEDTVCSEEVCWCGNENQALRIVDQNYERSRTLRIIKPKAGIPDQDLYQGYNASIYDRKR